MKPIRFWACLFSFFACSQAAPIFNTGTASFFGCGGSSPLISLAGNSAAGAGSASCSFSPAFSSNVAVNGFIEISGTGSGVFDSSFFPFGALISSISGPFTTSLSPVVPELTINGTYLGRASFGTSAGNGGFNYSGDAGSRLAGQTLNTWSVRLAGAPMPAPPGVQTGSWAFGYCVWLGSNQVCDSAATNSPSNPRLPDGSVPGGGWVFTNVPSGRWFDPPFVNGFQYTGTGGTLFDRITLPFGYGSAYTVWTGPGFGTLLGTFGPGAVDFAAGGISSFQVRGINPAVDAALANAFPLQIFFEGGVDGGFTQTPLDAIPEPSTMALVLLGGLSIAGLRLRRAHAPRTNRR